MLVRHRGRLLPASVLLSCLLAGSALAAGSDPMTHGATVGEWSAAWWNWAVQFPAAESPLFAEGDLDCALGQTGPAWFLAGNFGGTSHRSCTVPSDKALFFPIVNSLYWAPEDAETEADLRALAADDVDGARFLQCEIDGVPCTYTHAMAREQSPAFTLLVGPDSLFPDFGLEPGDRFPTISDGYWVMLSPLAPGDHVLRFAGKAPPYRTVVTYELHVVAP